jgi:hypothetical protein
MGSQIFLDTRAGDAIMGDKATATDGSITLTLHAIGTRPITQARLVRNGETIHEVTGDVTQELTASFTDEEHRQGTHWYYWRISQSVVSPVLPGHLMSAYGHLAWSSPSWIVVK